MSSQVIYCKHCSLIVPKPDKAPHNKIYCSNECYRGAKKIRNRGERTYKQNIEKVRAVWTKRHPKSDIQPAWPHRFDEDLVCEFCGIYWSENQTGLSPKCSNPQGYMDISIDRNGKPRVIKVESN
jgi:hypothetical protein